MHHVVMHAANKSHGPSIKYVARCMDHQENQRIWLHARSYHAHNNFSYGRMKTIWGKHPEKFMRLVFALSLSLSSSTSCSFSIECLVSKIYFPVITLHPRLLVVAFLLKLLRNNISKPSGSKKFYVVPFMLCSSFINYITLLDC